MSKAIRLVKKCIDLRLNIGVAKHDDRTMLMRLARQVADRGWWEGLLTDRDFADYVWAENNAKAIDTFQMTVIPGFLQTPEYAEALFSAGPDAQASNLQQLLDARIARSEILLRNNPPTIRYLFHEAVLHARIESISSEVYARQCEHLLNVAQ